MIENKKILILGMARSGVSVAKLLAEYNNNILITDMKEQESTVLKELHNLNIEVVIKENQEELLDESYDLVVKNPAIRKDNLAVLKAKSLNIPIINEVEVAYKFLPSDVTIIGITGSNGKTTTTTITYELLKTTGRNVFLGGNIGIPLSSIVKEIKSGDLLVLEISDHQLCDMYDFKTNISAITNLSEVHLDFHGSYEEYKRMKKRIFNHHTLHDIAILNKENVDVLKLTQDISSKKIYFSIKEKTDVYLDHNRIFYFGEEILNIEDIKIKGNHNYENIMVAITIAKQYGVTNEKIKEFLSEFNGVEHRIEFVRTVRNRKFYNDSKATNNESTIIALDSFKEKTILIMGGLDRNIPFDSIASHLQNVSGIMAYGETKEKIKDFAIQNHIPIIITDTLEEATLTAYQQSEEGDVILLSPACASWDQFESFEVRGNTFKKIVNCLE